VNGLVRYKTFRAPPINDELWHTLVVSHNWAIQKTSVYIDGALLGQVPPSRVFGEGENRTVGR